ncbi:MAG: FHA domain-containing protein, partial [Gemmatimonadales bacterium]|nr:FHA domain-containing protein [Gemmatimonadales bacterium]
DTVSAAAAQRAADKEAVLRFCQQLDQTSPPTPSGAAARTDCWKRLQLQGMGDALVDAKYSAAVNDYDSAMKADSMRRMSDSSTNAVNNKMLAAQRAIQTRNLDGAGSAVDDILAIQPNNQRALALKDRIDGLKRARQLKMTLFAVGAAVLALAAGLGILAKKVSGRHGQKVEQKKSAAAERKAVVKIVDGIGRGKIYTIESGLFRIGAASSDKPEERNDLVLSDTAAAISRYHCSIIRKDGRFYLIDSSLNGTVLNDAPLDRGEHHDLRDGDEFTVANVARLKFLMM